MCEVCLNFTATELSNNVTKFMRFVSKSPYIGKIFFHRFMFLVGNNAGLLF